MRLRCNCNAIWKGTATQLRWTLEHDILREWVLWGVNWSFAVDFIRIRTYVGLTPVVPSAQ